MRYLGILIAVAAILAGGYGVISLHDGGGWPIFGAGMFVLTYLITKPTIPPSSPRGPP